MEQVQKGKLSRSYISLIRGITLLELHNFTSEPLVEKLNYRIQHFEFLAPIFELNDLYSSRNIVQVMKSRRIGWAGHVARMGEERGVYRILVGKPERRRPLGRPRRRWVDNIRMDLQELECGYMDRIGLAQDRDRWRTLVSAVMNLRVP